MAWHLPKDLEFFKKTTLGKPIIMGRKSFESLGGALSGRPNIVISRTLSSPPKKKPTKIYKEMEAQGPSAPNAIDEGPFLYNSLEDGINAAKEIAKKLNVNEIFITGGGQIYKETLPITQRLYLTVLDRDYDGDTFFPKFDWNEWTIVKEEKYPADPEHDRPAFTFFTLERK